MLGMAQVKIRKKISSGEIFDERFELIDDDPGFEIAFLGKLYSEKLIKDQRFLDFCN